MRFPTTILLIILFFFTESCENKPASSQTSTNLYGTGRKLETVDENRGEPKGKPQVDFEFEAFDRQSNVERITRKITNKRPLVVHLLVPLCDNENQGIVKVSEKLGDGFNLQSNLYWGAMYGIKSHFKRANDWKLLQEIKDVNNSVLERAIFFKTFANGAKVYIVADAYKGDKMRPCLSDFLESIAGSKIDEMSIANKGESHDVPLYSEADLIIFNGHNGLMDFELEYHPNEDGVKKDVAVIGCSSFDFFKNHLNIGKAYPILTTRGLMAPEAYTAEAIINTWANNKAKSDFRLSAAKAYNKYQKCGMKGAMGLFKSGW